VTGVSGTGLIAQGIEFDSGRCVIEWLTSINSIAIYQSIDDVIAIHGHEGKTIVTYVNPWHDDIRVRTGEQLPEPHNAD
jgi:hypothetical protein